MSFLRCNVRKNAYYAFSATLKNVKNLVVITTPNVKLITAKFVNLSYLVKVTEASLIPFTLGSLASSAAVSGLILTPVLDGTL